MFVLFLVIIKSLNEYVVLMDLEKKLCLRTRIGVVKE